MRYLILVAALLTGCAAPVYETKLRMIAPSNCEATEFNMRFESDTTHKPMVVHWKVVDDPHAVCKGVGSHHSKGSTILACAKTVENHCTIYSAKNTSLAILGHEMRHCFEGDWHK